MHLLGTVIPLHSVVLPVLHAGKLQLFLCATTSFCVQSFLYILWYFLFSMLGNYNFFFFAAHLLDVAIGFKTLRTILQSVTHNGKQVCFCTSAGVFRLKRGLRSIVECSKTGIVLHLCPFFLLFFLLSFLETEHHCTGRGIRW